MLAIRPEKITTAHIQLRPGVRPTPPLGYRVRITLDTIISRETSRDQLNQPKYRGEPIYAGSVLDVTIPQWVMLRDSLKAVVVDDATPLFNAPPSIDSATQRPARFLALVGNGLNTIGDLAAELTTTRGEVARIASGFIADGTIKVNDRGVYVVTKKA